MILAYAIFILGCYRVEGGKEDDAGEDDSLLESDDISTTSDPTGTDPIGTDSSGPSSDQDTAAEDTGDATDLAPLLCDDALLIDDMEATSGRICATDGRNGVWYVFHDDTEDAQQSPSITDPGVPIEIAEIPDGRGESRFGIHTTGNGFISWGAGVGLDLAYNDGAYGVYDASAYTGISFWARSDMSTTIHFRVSTPETTLTEWGGTRERGGDSDCWWQPHATAIDLTNEWTRYKIYFPELSVDSDIQKCESPFQPDQLINLHLSDNYIQDISPLSALDNLEALNLSENNISDLTPLLDAAFPVGAEINLIDNPIDCVAQADVLTALEAQGAVVTSDCN